MFPVFHCFSAYEFFHPLNDYDLLEHPLWARDPSRHWEDHDAQAKQDPALKVLTPQVGGREPINTRK